MNEHYRITSEHTPEPLHQVLLSVGKSWMQWPGSKPKLPATQVHAAHSNARHAVGEAALDERTRETTIKQLAMALRLRGLDAESETMLASLETLALAGEISFRDYMGRAQNLFPNLLNTLDVTLRMKIVSLMVD